MPAGYHKFVLEQGADFQREVTWNDSAGDPVDVSDYSARMKVRPNHESDTVLLELTNANGRISLGGAAGTITLNVTAAITAALTPWNHAVYDLELVSGGGIVTRLLEGEMLFRREVTK